MLRAEKTLICGQTTYHSYMCTGTVLEARGGCNPGTKHQLMQQILGLFSIWRTVKHSTTPAKENRAIQMTDEQVPPPGLQNQQLLIFCAPKGAEETSQCSSQGCRNNTQIALLGGRKKDFLSEAQFFLWSAHLHTDQTPCLQFQRSRWYFPQGSFISAVHIWGLWCARCTSANRNWHLGLTIGMKKKAAPSGRFYCNVYTKVRVWHRLRFAL